MDTNLGGLCRDISMFNAQTALLWKFIAVSRLVLTSPTDRGCVLAVGDGFRGNVSSRHPRLSPTAVFDMWVMFRVVSSSTSSSFPPPPLLRFHVALSVFVSCRVSVRGKPADHMLGACRSGARRRQGQWRNLEMRREGRLWELGEKLRRHPNFTVFLFPLPKLLIRFLLF